MTITTDLDRKEGHKRPVIGLVSIFLIEMVVQAAEDDVPIDAKLSSKARDVDRNVHLGFAAVAFVRKPRKRRIVASVHFLENLTVCGQPHVCLASHAQASTRRTPAPSDCLADEAALTFAAERGCASTLTRQDAVSLC